MKQLRTKYIIYISIALVIMIGMILTATYAYYQKTSTQTNPNTYSVLTCLDVSFTSNTSSISLTNTYPLSDAEGYSLSPYNFTLENNCNSYVEYYLLLSVMTVSDQLSSSYVKIQLDGELNQTPTLIPNLETYTTPSEISGSSATYKLKAFGLEENESQTMNFRMWIDGTNENIWTANDVENKNFSVKLSIIGVAKHEFLASHIKIKLPGIQSSQYSTTFDGASWNNKTGSLDITSLTAKLNTINLTNQTSTTNLADYIISLSGTSQGTGEVVNENGYRYEGKNPNNYIIFNNELWRIIGVFDEDTHGQSDQNLVKIIRIDTIGGLAWDKGSTNDWPASSLNALLNEYYFNGVNESSVTYCYQYSTTVPGNCDFTRNGITTDSYRAMIENATWKLGGWSTNAITASSFYTYERGTTVYSGRPTSTTGYIGLMYLSDYGYAVLASSCTRTINLRNYSTNACGGQNWLYGQGHEWTIMPDSSNNYAFHLYDYGRPTSYMTTAGYNIRPVLYLKSNINKLTGDGSLANPYIITQ